MLLHWDQLPLHYGGEVATHRARFLTAGETTYGLLMCRFAPGDDRLAASGGDHAEERLLRSPLWMNEIPGALEGLGPYSSPLVVTLALNRSPCRNCARLLTEALHNLHRRFPARASQARFILASRGAYEGRADEAGRYPNATTTGDLRRLREAGWELCVLQVEGGLPPSGQALLQTLTSLFGGRPTVVRLDRAGES